MGIVTGIPDGTDLSGNVTSPANAGVFLGLILIFFRQLMKLYLTFSIRVYLEN